MIAGGPSRESLFDSLRLGTLVNVEFIFTNSDIHTLKAAVMSIKRNSANVYREPQLTFSECNDWQIELLVSKDYVVKNPETEMIYIWKGTYSTGRREGKLTSNLPACLIRK
jgi:hypothetical protein